MKNLWYLVAAYSAVWVIVASYLFTLLRRNRKLEELVSELENRVASLESRKKSP